MIKYDYKKNQYYFIFFVAIALEKIPDFFVLIFIGVAGYPPKNLMRMLLCPKLGN